MSGEILTQGTELFVLDTTVSPPALLKLTNATGFPEYGPESSDIDATNLDSVAMEWLTGLPDNGEVAPTMNLADVAAHRWLWDNQGTGARFWFFIGFSDGTTDPTTDGSTITPPTGRSCDIFQASVKTFRNSAEGNDILRATCVLRISGAITRQWKSLNP